MRPAFRALLPYCVTDRQREVVSALAQNATNGAAWRELGLAKRDGERGLARIRKIAALAGYAPEHDMTRTAPATHLVRGVSTLYTADGQMAAQWVKTDLRREAEAEAQRAVIEALRESVPRAKPVPAPKAVDPDLLNLFVVTDYHFGMRAHHLETRGDNWDTDIAEDLLIRWFGAAIAQSPRAETAVLAQLGDAIHFDSLSAVTPMSGHVLDADSRYQRLIRVVMRTFRRIVGMLLERHSKVVVLMAEGNHDMASSAWLREVFAEFYCDEPRVSVDTSADPYYCVEHGQTALFFHHGHLKRQDQVDRVFAAKFRETFGRTKHAFAHMGHYHHRREVESPLMVVRQHRTLAASDAYASRGGYLSGREAQVITYHREHGEVGSVTISPAMVAHGAR